MNFKICLVLSLFVCLSFAGFLPKHYWQNDERWGGDLIGFGSKTIRDDGSLLVSLASVVAGLGVYLDRILVDPPRLNEWLKKNDGFAQNDQIVWESLSPLGLEFNGLTTDHEKMVNAFVHEDILILKLKEGNHYVIVLYAEMYGFLCLDPDAYSYEGIRYYSFEKIEKASIYTVKRL